ncbi:MAG: FtsX-like permease family protein [Alphaproteobacteria bacterium]|nr:FtsX-like permease family protein [Alphaproteobacteria bacterium]
MAALAWTIARRELRGGAKGFRIFLACLALGVAAIAAVGSIAAAIGRGLESQGQSLLGGDVMLRMIHRDLTDAHRAFLDDGRTVSRSMTLRAMARPEAGDNRSLVELKAVDALYPLYGALRLAPARPPAEIFAQRDGVHGAAVEDALLRRLGIALGGRIQIGSARYEIRAIVENEPDRATSAQALALGPRILVGLDSMAATGLVQPGSLIWYGYQLRLPERESPAAFRTTLARAFPDAWWQVRDRTNAAPQVSHFVERTTLFLTLVGLTALVVGGVGVGNAVRHFLAGKTATIATFKCLGATAPLVFGVYLVQILVMAAIGIAIGLAIGAALPLLAAGPLAQAMNLPAEAGVYGGPLAIAALFGILVALAFSVWPIAQACEVPPGTLFRALVRPMRAWPRPVFVVLTFAAGFALAALGVASAPDRRLALWFVAGTAAALVLFRLAGLLITALARRVPAGRRTGLRLALANLHRPGAATGSIVVSLGLGLTVLVTVASIQGNLAHQIDATLPDRAPGFYFVDIQPDQHQAFEALVRAQPGFRALQSLPMLRGRITRLNDRAADDMAVAPETAWMLRGDRGVTWARGRPDDAKVVAGTWWPEDYRGPPLLSFTAEGAKGLGLAVGDTMTVNVLGRDITARIANLREVEWGTLRMNFAIVLSPGLIEAAPQTWLATVHADPDAELAIERVVTERFPNVTAIRVKDVLQTVASVLDKLAAAVGFTAAITLVAGTLVLAGAIVASHRRRVYDAVVLKVLGATRGRILGSFLVEYGILGLATAIVAGILGSIAAWAVVTQVMRLDWVFLPGLVAAAAFLCGALTIGMGLVGTWRALGQKPAPLLRNP